MRKEHLSQYLDGLEVDEYNKIKNDSSLEPWQKNFLFRFYERLKKREYKKKDVSKRVKAETDKHNLLFKEHKLPVNTLTEYTKYNPSKKLRALSVSNLIAISNALEVSIDYLLGIEECESHQNTDINKRTGLCDEAINSLKSNQLIQKQLNDYLLNHKFLKLCKAIENEKVMRNIYYGVSTEFSECLFNILQIAYQNFTKEVFPLDRTIEKYKEYLSAEILNSELLEKNNCNTLTEFSKKHLSKDLYSQFSYYVKENQIKKSEIYTTFVSFIAEFIYTSLEQNYNKDLSLNKISEAFLEVVNDYFKSS